MTPTKLTIDANLSRQLVYIRVAIFQSIAATAESFACELSYIMRDPATNFSHSRLIE